MLGRAAFAGSLLVGVRLLTRLSDLATMIVLARVLDPSSFGLVAIAMSVMLIIEASLELPVHNVLVRREFVSPDHFNTAFTLGATRGLVLAALLFALAVPFANFYHDKRLVALVCALALAPMFRSVASPRMVIFMRDLSFWREVVMEITGKLVAASVAITVAFTTHSYWAIAIGTIVSPIVMVATSYVLAPYRPRFGLKHLREFLDFLGWNSLAQIISAVNWQMERLLLGKLQPAAKLGLFSAANDVASMPYQAVFSPLYRPLYAAFARVKDDRAALTEAYARTSATVLAIGLPLLVGQACVAPATVELLLGQKWLAVIPYLRWLSISFVPALFAFAAGPLFMALGDTRLLFKRNFIEICCKAPVVLVGAIYFGFGGVIAARFFSEVMADAFCVITVNRLIGISFRDQLLAGWRSPVSAAFMGLVVLNLQTHTHGATSTISALVELLILVPAGGLAYAACHLSLWMIAGEPDGPERSALNILNRLRLNPRLRRLFNA